MPDEVKMPLAPDGEILKEWFNFVAEVSKQTFKQTVELKESLKCLTQKIEELEEKLSDDLNVQDNGDQPIKISKNEQIKRTWKYLKKGGELENTIKRLLSEYDDQHSPMKKIGRWNLNTEKIFTFIYRIGVIGSIIYIFFSLLHFEEIVNKVLPLVK